VMEMVRFLYTVLFCCLALFPGLILTDSGTISPSTGNLITFICGSFYGVFVWIKWFSGDYFEYQQVGKKAKK